MPALEDLPPLSPATTIALVALLLCLWLAVRVQILRRQEAQGDEGAAPGPAPRWLRRLADAPATLPLLALAAAGLVALLVLGLRS